MERKEGAGRAEGAIAGGEGARVWKGRGSLARSTAVVGGSSGSGCTGRSKEGGLGAEVERAWI